jgi:hypothetical protein
MLSRRHTTNRLFERIAWYVYMVGLARTARYTNALT